MISQQHQASFNFQLNYCILWKCLTETFLNYRSKFLPEKKSVKRPLDLRSIAESVNRNGSKRWESLIYKPFDNICYFPRFSLRPRFLIAFTSWIIESFLFAYEICFLHRKTFRQLRMQLMEILMVRRMFCFLNLNIWNDFNKNTNNREK